MRKNTYIFAVLIAVVLGAVYLLLHRPHEFKVEDFNTILKLEDYYSVNVQPVFNAKCVACHSCYNSPCQLNLTSYEGVMRGANKVNVYDFPKIEARKPTRLYQDAHSVEAWREMGFYPVTSEGSNSLMNYMLSRVPGIESGLQNNFDSEGSRVCMASNSTEEIQHYTKQNPAGRMPFGFPALSADEMKSIVEWQKLGMPGPELAVMEKNILQHRTVKELVSKWESFFNGPSAKEKLVARYFYEHLFLANIYFESLPHLFFRLVRSETLNGPIKEISTSLPFDDPGNGFHYRLRPETNTIMHKSNIPFEFSNKRLAEWKSQFLGDNWNLEMDELPAYDGDASNPFKTFAKLPAKARYNLFLKNSAYFIMTFIKGPVCRGQTALNVINDHFWVLFLDPQYDVMVNSQEAYNLIAKEVQFPSLIGSDFEPLIDFKDKYWKSVSTKFQFLKDKGALNMAAIWNGEKENSNANITVFRHFDSATVLKGLRGQTPKTVWVLDYHVFESIYYNLSSGYNVFGPLLHQLNSRLFMEVSRVASEDLFLSFLPKEDRLKLRTEWNLPVPDKKESLLKKLTDLVTEDVTEKLSKEYVFEGQDIESDVSLSHENPKLEFLKQLKTHRFSDVQSHPVTEESDSANPMVALSKLSADIVQRLPDASLVVIESSGRPDVWTLIHNKDHFNVAMLLFEAERRRPEKDDLSVIKGLGSSYANLIFAFKKDQLSSFVSELSNVKTDADYRGVLEKYAISRKDPGFWQHYSELSKVGENKLTNERGQLDLNRYISF